MKRNGTKMNELCTLKPQNPDQFSATSHLSTNHEQTSCTAKTVNYVQGRGNQMTPK